MNLKTEAAVVDELSQKLKYQAQLVADSQEEHDSLVVDVEHAQSAQNTLQHIAQGVQQQAHARISEVVTKCLTAVFDDPYQFRIDFDRKRGKTEARLVFTRDGMDVDPLTASGGGMIDVAAFALRVACLALHRPKLSPVLVLDEPFKFVSENYRMNVRTMLEEISSELKIQIVMVTHIRELEVGEVVEI